MSLEVMNSCHWYHRNTNESIVVFWIIFRKYNWYSLLPFFTFSFFICRRTCSLWLSLSQWFTNFSMFYTHVEGLLKTQIAGSHPQSFWIRRSVGGSRICISNKFLGDADVTDSGVTLIFPKFFLDAIFFGTNVWLSYVKLIFGGENVVFPSVLEIFRAEIILIFFNNVKFTGHIWINI